MTYLDLADLRERLVTMAALVDLTIESATATTDIDALVQDLRTQMHPITQALDEYEAGTTAEVTHGS